LYGFNTHAAMYGGTGNDVYYLDRWGDTVTEYADEGLDTIVVDYGYSLASLPHVENLTLIDPTFVDLIPYKNFGAYGNALNNTLRGNSGHNVLAGGAGDDILLGGDGNDVYLVEGNDYLSEDSAGGGLDRIVSAANISIPVYFEEAVLTGNLDIDATGNEDSNRLLGNAGKNHLRGGAGADVLVGDANVDVYQGVTGTYLQEGDAGVTRFVPPYTSTALALGDAQIQVDGQIFTGDDQIFVSRYGTVSFGQAFDALNTDLQAGTEPSLLLAPLWGLWYPGSLGAVLVQLMDDTGDGINDHLRVQWDMKHELMSTGYDARFQVEIQNGQISYHYFALDERAVAYDNHHLTIGAVLSDGPLLLSHNRFVQANQTIVIKAGGDDDILDGGSGADTLQGGSGNDQYVVDDFGDVVIEGVGKGTDSVRSTVDFTLAANIENLTLQGPLDIDGTGNDLANTLTGNSGDNILSGGAGKDSLSGDGNTLAPEANTLLGGMELLAGDAGVSAILGNDDDTSVALDLGAAVITVAGQNFTGDNQLYISSNGLLSFGAAYTESFNTNLQAGTEPAFLLAALWDDWVTNRDAQDQVLVKLSDDNGDGTQDHLQVQWDVHHYSAGNNLVSFQVEIANGQVKYHYFNLDTGDAGTANGVSATLGLKVPGATELLSHNALVSGWGTLRWAAGAGDDALDGGAGNDTMSGGGGNDRYQVDSRYDKTLELANGGEDEVFSTVSLTLANEIEHLTLQGTALGGTGNALANRLTGNSANNTLNGRDGNDTLYGGDGLDSLYGGTGTDTLEGGAGNDFLDGGTSADIMRGGLGDDTYVRSTPGDVIEELFNQGIDTVQTAATYSLGSNLENVLLTGNLAINATGNVGVNTLTGNSAINTLNGKSGDDYLYGGGDNDILIGELGNDYLDGGVGSDTLQGGAGNDTYVRNNSGDVITELANEGTDTVLTTLSYSLGAEIEHATLTGANVSNLIGQAKDNQLTGNQAANTLDGQGGLDVLTGGLGNDTYLLKRGYAADRIVENDATVNNLDIVQFGVDIAADQLWLRRVGNDLHVSVIGTADQITVQNWYLGNAYHTEQLKSGNGKTLSDANVQNLVNAMAGMTPPPMGQTNLTAAQHAQLDGVIAANWL